MGERLGREAWQSLLKLSGASDVGLQAQLRKALSAAIADGTLNALTPLPSSRNLSRMLGISRTTVSLSYQKLVDDGYLVSHERQGYFVNPEMNGSCNTLTETGALRHEGGVNWESRCKVRLGGQRNISKPRDWRRYPFPFIYGQRDRSIVPVAAWRECWREAQSVQGIAKAGCDLLDRDDPDLLEHVRSRVLPRRGIWVRPENILITLGTQNALALVARLLIRRTDLVGIENPGYPDARNMFQLESNHVVPLPVDEDGLIVNDALDRCGCIYTTPSLQSPTGVVLSADRRQALLRKAAANDIIIIEDDYEREGGLGERSVPALKSEDETGHVIYCGSFSKALGSGLRLGFLVADAALIEQARALRRLMFRHPPTLIQQAVKLFIEYGHYDVHINRMASTYSERWEVLTQALERFLPECRWPREFAGSALWVGGPEWLDADSLAAEARSEGVLIEPGSVHYADPQAASQHFRLGFSALPAERITEGIERLSKVMETLRVSDTAVLRNM
jgi:GntR family transcriptional regulator/MocR family aminotransferase